VCKNLEKMHNNNDKRVSKIIMYNLFIYLKLKEELDIEI
jgi:hypothetical protein